MMTDHTQVDREINDRRMELIPPDIQKLSYYAGSSTTFSVSSFLAERGRSKEELDRFMKEKREISDAVVFIFQSNLSYLCRGYDRIFFSSSFSLKEGNVNVRNVFGKLISKNLKDLATFSVRFDDHKYQKVLLLPLRNFAADEIGHLVKLFSSEDDRSSFGSRLDGILGSLRKRQTPKRPKSRSVEYLKDDRDRFFEYGHERHSLPETKTPPHDALCIFGQRFRFGRGFDIDRHFNISAQPDGARISGEMKNCHDTNISFSERTHVNMFPNDFCTP